MYFLYSVYPAITSYIIVLVPVLSFLLLLRILLSALPVLTKKVAAYYIFHCGSHLTSTHFVYSTSEILYNINICCYHVNYLCNIEDAFFSCCVK